MKTTIDNIKFRQGSINIILGRLTPLHDVTKSNTTNITNNYNISQINKNKSEFNTTLIDNNIENIKSIKNDIGNYYKLKDIIMFDILKTNTPEEVNINTPKFVIIQTYLNNYFKKDRFFRI